MRKNLFLFTCGSEKSNLKGKFNFTYLKNTTAAMTIVTKQYNTITQMATTVAAATMTTITVAEEMTTKNNSSIKSNFPTIGKINTPNAVS